MPPGVLAQYGPISRTHLRGSILLGQKLLPVGLGIWMKLSVLERVAAKIGKGF
jgi:hypothetical protein